MVKIKFKRLDENAVVPQRATALSGGLDIVATKIECDGEVVTVNTGLAMQPPPGYMIRISPRSSITKTRWILQNSPALGDADYTGEYILKFRSIPKLSNHYSEAGELITEQVCDTFPFSVGDRVAQMWVEKVIDVVFVEEELDQTDRGSGGFGSTGFSGGPGLTGTQYVEVDPDTWNYSTTTTLTTCTEDVDHKKQQKRRHKIDKLKLRAKKKLYETINQYLDEGVDEEIAIKMLEMLWA